MTVDEANRWVEFGKQYNYLLNKGADMDITCVNPNSDDPVFYIVAITDKGVFREDGFDLLEVIQDVRKAYDKHP